MNTGSKADVLLGLQWGDEGKGKIVDVLTPQYKVVARFQGGPNAGHTLEFENKKFVLHTIPSGIFHPSCINLIGSGVVIDPYVFMKEVDHLGLGMNHLKLSLLVSFRVHLILPSHRLLDHAQERSRGQTRIGSTLKGIGPAYADKAARSGLRLVDALAPDFQQHYEALKQQHLRLAGLLGTAEGDVLLDGVSFADYEQAWFEGLQLLTSMEHVDCERYINEALDEGGRVLAEGAQGTLLDLDFGSYPYVTSSTTIAAGACTGLGLAPARIGSVLGVFKAYCTRVGGGPFPTELHDEVATHLRNKGKEFGSTTGRARRCGWLDLPALKYAVMINGVTGLIMTKLDVLCGLDKVKLCVAYREKGEEFTHLPVLRSDHALKPVYREFNGWDGDLGTCRSFGDLPLALKDYLRFIEDFVGVGVDVVSTGPDRTQTIFRKPL